MIAALCHDLEHPGVNNQFLVKSKSSLATLYNNESILEKHVFLVQKYRNLLVLRVQKYKY
jgi:hypothetical protein